MLIFIHGYILQLFDVCIAPKTSNTGVGCDNMTCIIVKLKQNQTTSISE